MPGIDFWFSIGSTYTYLTVMRLADVARQEGVTFRWRPFSVRALMVEQGNIPFRDKPIKAAYMWRDIERRAGQYGLPVRVPAPYPLKAWDLVNRIAVLAAEEGWCADYARETYRRWFQQGIEPGIEPSLSEVLRLCGQDPARVMAAAEGEAVGLAYAAATDAARRVPLFGAPSFVVGSEVFWGDDRLDDAIAWLRRGSLAPA